MGRGVSRNRVQRLAAAFALLGIAFYSLLLPWHLTSQFAAQLFQAEFGNLGNVLCSSTPASADNPAAPGAPATNCPICKGLSSFHLALEPAAPAALPLPLAGERFYAWPRDDVTDTRPLTPRSRGPPARA